MLFLFLQSILTDINLPLVSDTDKAVQAAATMVRLNPGSNDSLEVSKFFKKTEGVRLEEQVLKQVRGLLNIL